MEVVVPAPFSEFTLPATGFKTAVRIYYIRLRSWRRFKNPGAAD